MSARAVEWAIYEAPMLVDDKGKPDATSRQVLQLLAFAQDGGNVAYLPQVGEISYATGLTPAAVARALAKLETAKLIKRMVPNVNMWQLDLSRRRTDSLPPADDVAAGGCE